MKRALALVTGGARGLGAAIASALLERGYAVDVGCRRPEEAAGRRPGRIDIKFRALDLASFTKIRHFVDACRSEGLRYDLIVNNAGVCNWTHKSTVDGYEATLATNYLGPFLLTRLLLADASPSHGVVNIGSSQIVTSLNLATLLESRNYDMAVAYATSKTLLAAFNGELRDRMPAPSRVVCIHPGLLRTHLGGNGAIARFSRLLSLPLAASPTTGANRVIAAFDSDSGPGRSSGFFIKTRAARYPHCVADSLVRRQIWNWSSDLVGLPP
jgi:NAD(P)-dependent dehydrogenase (short-subunit alcohol dehydrogenase family)